MSTDDRTGIVDESLRRLRGARDALLSALLPRHAQLARFAEERRGRDVAAHPDAVRNAVLEAIDLPAFVLSADGGFVHANSSAVALYGPITEGAHLSSRIRAPDILETVREASLAKQARTIEHAERLPSERWFQVRIAPMESDNSGGLFLLTFRDLTEARRMDRMRSDFVANASHELRTPLASLTGFIETLQGPARDDAAARERFLAIMREQAERMSRLVDDLMSLSRLELRAHVSPSGTVDLVPLIAHVCETLEPMAGELGVTIRFDRPQRPATITGERDELIQVFQNLVENGCKYGQSGGFVDVAIRWPGDGAETPPGMLDVAVRDYGPGIPRGDVPRLTERFYRVSVEKSRSRKGTGLGLAIVKHILTRHRGRLIVKSELGKGSVFIARLPSA